MSLPPLGGYHPRILAAQCPGEIESLGFNWIRFMMSATPALSVIVPAHNPDPERLRQVLAGLRAQSLVPAAWECLLVDNASTAFPLLSEWTGEVPPNMRVVHEPNLGLTSARKAGLRATRGAIAVFADDDNVLAPDYLEQVIAIFAGHARVGVIGGKVLPRFEMPPPGWAEEFLPLLALRDLGEVAMVSNGLRHEGHPPNRYPAFAPIGAGMALRREAANAWLDAGATGTAGLDDRRGQELSSAGDNDIVFCAMRAGWEVGYFPQLALTHLIPQTRLDAGYLARLNRGIQKSWMQVLLLHDGCPWSPVTPLGSRLRKLKAWFTYRAWASPAARIRWWGACGHFEGRVVGKSK